MASANNHPLGRLQVILSTLLLLSACNRGRAVTPTVAQGMGESPTRSITCTLSPIAVSTASPLIITTPSPKLVVSPTLTFTPLPSVTLTPSFTLTPKQIVQRYDVAIETGFPISNEVEGVLVITGINDQLLDFPSMKREFLFDDNAFIPTWTWSLISPDRNRLAYLELGSSADQLRIITADGQQQSVNNWPDGQKWEIIGWVDNQRLAFIKFFRLDGLVNIFDTTTGEWQDLIPSFPAISPNGGIIGADQGSISPFVIYDSTLTRIAILRYRENQEHNFYGELWDTQSKAILWQRRGGPLFASRPVWSPEGGRFAVILQQYSEQNDPYIDYGDLYVVDRNGQETLKVDFVAGQLSWSPDGRFIATWWRRRQDFKPYSVSNPLAIVDSTSGEISVYWWSEGDTAASEYPIWSPDSRYVAFNNTIEIEGKDVNRVIVVDLIQKRAYEVARNMALWGWMAKP